MTWIRWTAGFVVGVVASGVSVAWATAGCDPPWPTEHRWMVPEAQGGALDLPCELWVEGQGDFEARVHCQGERVCTWEDDDAR